MTTTDKAAAQDLPVIDPADDDVLTADDVLNTSDVVLERLEIPEWQKNGKPGVVFIRSMSAEESLKFQDLLEGPARKNALFLACIQAVVDKHGAPLFTDKNLEALKKKNIKAFRRIQDAILKVNGATDEQRAAAKNG